MERIEAERERLEDRLERAQHLYLLGDVSREEYNSLRDEVKRKLNALKPTQEPDLEEAARLLEDIGALLRQATPEELKEVFNALLDSVYLGSGEAGPVIAVEPWPFVRQLIDISGFPEVFVPGGDEDDAHKAGAACERTPEMGVVPGAKCDTIPADVGGNCGMVGAGLFSVVRVAPALIFSITNWVIYT